MTKVVLIVLLWMHDGSVHVEAEVVAACPNRGFVYQKYEALKAKGAMHDWHAWCYPVYVEPLKEKIEAL